VPAHRWNFIENDPIGPRRFFLGDHGAEIVSGLVEWHRIEVATNAPTIERHRAGIRKLLDRLLVKGRATNGLWHSQIDVPSGRVRNKDLTDNWGYLGQAYLNQAAIERTLPVGERTLADQLEGEVVGMLRGVADVRYYAWQSGEMDGYADTLEGALYLLRYLDVPEAADWLHEQMAVLYGFQHDDGRVTDDNIDGNFLRTTLLYGLTMTQGVRVEPWSEAVAIGAVRDGACVQLHLHAAAPWTGRVMFDSKRHREHLRLPADYPRLNQWPEWFPIEADRAYVVTDEPRAGTIRAGRELLAGLPISLEPDRAYAQRVCPR